MVIIFVSICLTVATGNQIITRLLSIVEATKKSKNHITFESNNFLLDLFRGKLILTLIFLSDPHRFKSGNEIGQNARIKYDLARIALHVSWFYLCLDYEIFVVNIYFNSNHNSEFISVQWSLFNDSWCEIETKQVRDNWSVYANGLWSTNMQISINFIDCSFWHTLRSFYKSHEMYITKYFLHRYNIEHELCLFCVRIGRLEQIERRKLVVIVYSN